LVRGGELVAGDYGQCGVGEQNGTFDAQFVEASLRHVFCVGLQLGGGGAEFAATVASLVEQQPAVAQEVIDFDQARPNLLGFKLQQSFARLPGIALGFEVRSLLFELLVLGFALQFSAAAASICEPRA